MAPADAAIQFALQQVGKPYKWGATGPNAYDCSGLVQASFRHAGIDLPRTTATQILKGQRVAKSQLMPGDLVFPDPGHVQIYLGGGKVVEAPRTGLKVRVVPMWGFWQARRVTQPATNPFTVSPAGLNDCYTYVPNPYGGTIPVPNGKCGNEPGVPNPGTIPDVVNPFEYLSDAMAAFADIFSWITDGHNWVRIGQFVMGFVLLIIAVLGLSRVQTAGKAVANVVA